MWSDIRSLVGEEGARTLEKRIRRIGPDLDAAMDADTYMSEYKGFPLQLLVDQAESKGRLEAFEKAVEEVVMCETAPSAATGTAM